MSGSVASVTADTAGTVRSRAAQPAQIAPPAAGSHRVRHLGQRGAALRAFAQLRSEARPIQEMQVEPAADRRGARACVERAERGLEEVEERRGRNAVGREAIDELGDVPAGRDEREVVAHVGVDGARFGAGQDVELTTTRELVGGVRQRLRVPGHAARRSPYTFCDDTHFAEMAREEDENPICLGEVVRLENDRLGTATCEMPRRVNGTKRRSERGTGRI